MICYLPARGEEGLPFDSAARDSGLFLGVLGGGAISAHPGQGAADAGPQTEWVLSTRSTMLMLHQSTTSSLEPYYSYRFARNFGYNQGILSNREFPLTGR